MVASSVGGSLEGEGAVVGEVPLVFLVLLLLDILLFGEKEKCRPQTKSKRSDQKRFTKRQNLSNPQERSLNSHFINLVFGDTLVF